IFRRELLYANAFLVPLPINHQHHQMRKVLVLDLDETLIHAYRFQSPRYEVNVNMPPDFFVTINRDRYCVHRRPYVDFFLDTVSRWYKLVVFTAATEEYGQGVMKHLDGGRNILNTLYHRKNLTFLNGVKTKGFFNTDHRQRSLHSFILNPDNAIPIKSWYLDSMDAALVDLLPMLDCLLFTQDVRSVLSRRRQTFINMLTKTNPSSTTIILKVRS
ncbi:CTD nuclear envelope phosphatase 1, partial [Orchesella cincta]